MPWQLPGLGCRTVGNLNSILLFQLASRQGEVEKNIQALNVQVKKLDDAIKELQKKFKDAETVLATAIFQVGIMLFSILHYVSNLNPLLHVFSWGLSSGLIVKPR